MQPNKLFVNLLHNHEKLYQTSILSFSHTNLHRIKLLKFHVVTDKNHIIFSCNEIQQNFKNFTNFKKLIYVPIKPSSTCCCVSPLGCTSFDNKQNSKAKTSRLSALRRNTGRQDGRSNPQMRMITNSSRTVFKAL